MRVLHYPDYDNMGDESGSIGKFFKGLKRKRPDL